MTSPRPRRVALVAQSYYTRDPRVQRAAQALHGAGYQVDVFCLRDTERSEPASECLNGVRVIRLPLGRQRGGKGRYVMEYAAFFAMAAAAMVRYQLTRRYDLIHINTHPDALVFAAAIPKLLGARVLLDMHDPMPETLASRYGVGGRHWLVRLTVLFEQAAVRFADHVITVHEPLRQVFISRGAPAQKIDIVMNLADVSHLPPRRQPAEARPERFVVLYAGTIAAHYGLDLAVRAVASLRDEIPGLRLRIVGEGDHLPELRRIVTELGVEDLVEFLPPVPHQAIWALMQDADVGISPHRPNVLFRLSLSNKIYEYVATGLPAVVPRTECLERYYPEEVVAFFKPGNWQDLARVLLKLSQAPAERQARVEAGWRLVERWNWTNERDHLVEIVDAMVNRSALGGRDERH